MRIQNSIIGAKTLDSFIQAKKSAVIDEPVGVQHGHTQDKYDAIIAVTVGTALSNARQIPLKIEDQGDTNGCGTTSLAAVLSHWGVARTRRQVDASIRKFDIFTSVDDIADYAHDNGMRTQIKNKASLEDLALMIDQGAPPIVLMDPDGPYNLNQHYMVAVGYERDSNGAISKITFADPSEGGLEVMDADEFNKQWSNLKMHGIGTGMSRVMISIVPNDDRIVVGTDGVSRKASDIRFPKLKFWDQFQSQFGRSIGSLITDISNGLGRAKEGVITAVKTTISAAKVVGNVIWQGCRSLGKSIVSGITRIGDGIGSTLKKAGDTIVSVAKSAWNKFKSWF